MVHSFKGYDSHLIIEQAYIINETISNKKFSVLPQSSKELLMKKIDSLSDKELTERKEILASLRHKKYKWYTFKL